MAGRTLPTPALEAASRKASMGGGSGAENKELLWNFKHLLPWEEDGNFKFSDHSQQWTFSGARGWGLNKERGETLY